MRGHEVPVGGHERHDGSGHRRQGPAEDRHQAGDGGIDQEHVVQPEVLLIRLHHEGRHRQRHQGAKPCEQPAPAPQRRATEPAPCRGACRRMRDHMDIDRPRSSDDLHEGHPPGDLLETRSTGGAEDDLGGVLGAGEFEQRLAHIVPHHLVIVATEVLEEGAVLLEGGVVAGEAVGRSDVHPEEFAARPHGHARCPANHCLASGNPGDAHHHSLPSLPGLDDALAAPIGGEGFFHPVGGPRQRQLAQRREVPGTEVVGECSVDSLGWVDLPCRQPIADSLLRKIHEFDLVGSSHDCIGDRLALQDAGDLEHDVVERLQMLDVQGREHIDSGAEEIVDVFPALLVTAPGHIGVSELVDQHQAGMPGQHRVDVHFLEGPVPVGDAAAGHDLEVADSGGGVDAAVGLDDPDYDVAAFGPLGVALIEHGKGLPDAGSGPEKHAKTTAAHGAHGTRATTRRGQGSASAR